MLSWLFTVLKSDTCLCAHVQEVEAKTLALERRAVLSLLFSSALADVNQLSALSAPKTEAAAAAAAVMAASMAARAAQGCMLVATVSMLSDARACSRSSITRNRAAAAFCAAAFAAADI